MGYIFYVNDPNISDEVENEIKERIENSKGVGNFKNMFVSIPEGNPDGIKLIPVGDLNSAKDAHRFPAGLSGVIPANGSNTGDVTKLRKNYMATETKVLQDLIRDSVNSDQDILDSPFKNNLLFDFEVITQPSD